MLKRVGEKVSSEKEGSLVERLLKKRVWVVVGETLEEEDGKVGVGSLLSEKSL